MGPALPEKGMAAHFWFPYLAVELARLYPDKLVLGMEIRAKLTEFVRKRIEVARINFPGQYQNAGVWR